MLKVGLTGGLACGKTFVGEELARLGCQLIQADELGHAVLEPDGEAFAGVVREFGPGVLDENGRIDRRRLAAEVFGKPARLEALNALVHPPVVRREEQLMARIAAQDPHAIVVMEAAILIETGSYRRFDRIVLVVCAEELQIECAVKRGATREEALARLARQMPLAEKRKFADYVIDTSGEKEETLRQTRRVYDELRRIEA
jgi:dephospho-CoA kinase